MFRVLFLLLFAVVGQATATPRLVASIPPVHALVAAVSEGVSVPHLLVQGGGSPHAYALRPSDMRVLADADALFWVGPQLELFLTKPAGQLRDAARNVSLADLPGLLRLPAREGGVWGGHAGHGHGEHEIDPHLWLDPANARVMVSTIAAVLVELDPPHAERYRTNRDRTLQRLDALEARVARQLAPVTGVPYVVFHDAYQYFEHRFGLQPVGAVVASPEQITGARRLREIRETLRERGARCVFSEPQFRPTLVDTVLEGTGARHAVLDPLGAALVPGPEAYFQLIESMASTLVKCLGG